MKTESWFQMKRWKRYCCMAKSNDYQTHSMVTTSVPLTIHWISTCIQRSAIAECIWKVLELISIPHARTDLVQRTIAIVHYHFDTVP